MRDLSALRVACYARFSSDKQSEASVEDQLHRCRQFAEVLGGTIPDELVYADKAISGAVRHRPDFDRLHADVKARRFDVLLVESLSRLTRDMEDAGRLQKNLAFYDVRLIGVADGIDSGNKGSKLLYGIHTMLAESKLDELGDQTHRGMAGRARAAKVTGALPLGYGSVECADGDGKRVAVDANEAELVLSIFTLFANGMSLQAIAAKLNAEGVPNTRRAQRMRAVAKRAKKPLSPTTKKQVAAAWGHTGVRAVLRNECYVGVWIWNKRRFMKDPETRKRVSRLRPREEWIVDERPELRVVPQEIWDAVQARFTRNAGPGARPAKRSYLLSGLLQCGVCGEPMTINGGDETRRYYSCSAAHKRGTCHNRTSVLEKLARDKIVAAIRERLGGHVGLAYVRQKMAERLGNRERDLGGEIDACRRPRKSVGIGRDPQSGKCVRRPRVS